MQEQVNIKNNELDTLEMKNAVTESLATTKPKNLKQMC